MQTKKDITPFNEEGEPHGYWESYYSNGQLYYKGNYVNGEKNGYWEVYYLGERIMHRGNYINDEEVGLWFENGKEIFYAD